MEYKELDQVNVGDRLEINGEVFTVQERSYHEKAKEDEWHHDSLRFELGNDYVLERGWEWSFFQIIRGKWLFGMFTWANSRVIKIESLKIL